MNVLVLGGSGFIGSNLCETLVQLGHHVKIMDRSMKKTDFNFTQIEFIEADFTQIEDFKPILQGIDIIYHLISTTVPATSNVNKIYDISSNVCSTIQLLDACVQTGVKKIIFLSSGGTIYGQTEVNLIPEEHPTNPICSYGIQKLTIEKYLYYYNHEYGLDYHIIRLANPYGKGQIGKNGQGVIPIFIRKIMNNEEIQIWGDGSTTRDYIYIDDATQALCMLLEYKGDCKLYNLGSGQGVSLLDIVNCISEVVNIQAKIRFMEARSIDVKSNVLDISKITKELHWEPRKKLKDGIYQMYLDIK
ncbi:NAD-dependent epimerase/dehydratase family protein [Paenibacillus selenitireducens]|uniref:NAD-dependent epimerase/dehydratase family protein n=1 Tax=Paenibacillus selenitireducens TaxID=1324314 RepID=UPI0009971760|nr:NAD-dependent epimerase/dehydratase family protein [Paenibacillus selenitireducens]